MTGPLPPQDLDAERAVLGACLLSPDAYRHAAALISDDDWYRPHHAVMWQAMRGLAERGEPVDPITVHAELQVKAADRFLNTNLPLLLHDYVSGVPSAVNVAHYCSIVVEAALRRRMIRTMERGIQRAYDADDPGVLLGEVQAELSVVERIASGDRAVLSTPLDVFMRQGREDDEPPWVVPGLLARQDRVVLTGSGGVGKSTLVYQLLICAAAGLDPLDPEHGDRYAPVRVLAVDCENPDYLTRSRLWPLLRNCRRLGVGDVESRVSLAGSGNTLNLLDPVQAAELLATVEHDRPDLVYVGPFYKMHNDDPDREVVVKKVTGAIDRIRETGAAVIMEAHPNKEGRRGGSMEPSGSGVWNWWPEFGIGVRTVKDAPQELRLCVLERWRIDRVKRSWPVGIEAGDEWPWRASAVSSW